MRSALAACRERRGNGIDADMAFHAVIAEATRNPILSQFYGVMVGYLRRHFAATLAERQYDPAALALHDDLLAAMERQDAAAAQAIVGQIVAFDTAALR